MNRSGLSTGVLHDGQVHTKSTIYYHLEHGRERISDGAFTYTVHPGSCQSITKTGRDFGMEVRSRLHESRKYLHDEESAKNHAQQMIASVAESRRYLAQYCMTIPLKTESSVNSLAKLVDQSDANDSQPGYPVFVLITEQLDWNPSFTRLEDHAIYLSPQLTKGGTLKRRRQELGIFADVLKKWKVFSEATANDMAQTRFPDIKVVSIPVTDSTELFEHGLLKKTTELSNGERLTTWSTKLFPKS
ncbi:hypothetical protein I302_100890 [Kwoniella bestiolae CBS 10118]|uniref:Uncharacterized protein n=1 Tax=Kwoniella bestiolae CBS 10118 TaxID=1296100 RepID=A0A1B9G6F1_9TREE|nr:hypothetical protein I302_04264 [Kwoniella bestiolae CBS 10118]OCF26578.1 hypothetical protein I302_04264 [Kwoniella bestiolae CBS 10118]